MRSILFLQNPIQNYPWGSLTAIPELLGASPTGEPQAELWMGAHPKSPSMVMWEGRPISLRELIAQYPEDILGPSIARRFNNELPYLFKVLAAGQPLSIQAHPNRRQAVDGFARENKLGIAMNAPERNYRDENHKPECICALTPFWGLNEFRKVKEIELNLRRLCPKGLSDLITVLEDFPNESGLRRFFGALMAANGRKKEGLIAEIVSNAEKLLKEAPLYDWIVRLHEVYPSDLGILSPAFLNLVRLEPGEALFLESGVLHAYLEGVGIELMANSDNVLRGGLTPKHVDPDELFNVLVFREKVIEVLRPLPVSPCEGVYTSRAAEFFLSVLTLSGGMVFIAKARRGVEILFCTAGTARLYDGEEREPLDIRKGQAFLVPAAAPAYRISGDAVLFKAAVPLNGEKKY